MNSQIEQWRVQAFASNVFQLSQQKGSRLAPLVRRESFVGKSEFFDRLGLATAVDKTGRNEDTPNLDIEHSRRMLTTVTRHWGSMVDRKDKLQNIHNPESEYSVAAMNALGRKMDDVILRAAFGSAVTGEAGTGTQTLGTGQKVACVSGGALDYANVQGLRKAKLLLDQAEAVGPRYIVHAADFLERLLAQTEVTSSDYNSVKALVQGELDTYLGFKFVRTEIIGGSDFKASTLDSDTFLYSTTTGLYNAAGSAIGATDRVALAFVGDGIILGENTGGRIARVDERADKAYSNQIYSAMDMGAVRMEEAKVVQIIYKA